MYCTASGAQFAISTGDIGYPNGSQTNYGDLNQTGANVSAVFGPQYWAVPGQSIPLHGVTGNHGQNSNFLNVWPEKATVRACLTNIPVVCWDAAGRVAVSVALRRSVGVD